ncbi:MAG: hypothetical protein ONB48_12470 [candidate division KSB1 bacterium]|nr:hypothetical protein [candidate division KSB1 bacterium]MDZ7275091.1 hypothetical protein [candidate division KSB1 bacterium]MDZ7286461.1 hypothetical protein [candidate division KSB1 bacterium]MDZ7299375.1 hypothetical protein [candidate division KSB1 bacterium]MDZ7306296.1 hypothetical protein [candidate division KSB1 bacterium]
MAKVGRAIGLLAGLCSILTSMALAQSDSTALQPTTDNGEWFILKKEDLAGGTHHTRHAEIFGKYVTGCNVWALRAIDKVQATARDGGGYFTGINAVPTESPVGYALALFGKPLLSPPRTTSYCSGATYAAFIEQLNLMLPHAAHRLSPERLEALRMQEPDGSRREDTVKFWGKWNDDGFGSHYALVQYAQMGSEIKPRNARPGDFMNVSWKNGLGHSVIFLGYYRDENGGKNVVYWSSQTRTNGFGDEVVPLERIKEVKIVRLTAPQNLFSFDIDTPVKRDIPGDVIDW